MLRRIAVLLCLLLVVCQVTAMATPYFVRVSGNDNNDGLSPITAVATLDRASYLVAPGDTIYIGAGIYNEILVPKTSGTAEFPIAWIGDVNGTYTGDPGEINVNYLCMDYSIYTPWESFPATVNWYGDHNYINRIHFGSLNSYWNWARASAEVRDFSDDRPLNIIFDGCVFDDAVHLYQDWYHACSYKFYNCTFGANAYLNKYWAETGTVIIEAQPYDQRFLDVVFLNSTFYQSAGTPDTSRYGFSCIWNLVANGIPNKIEVKNCAFYLTNVNGWISVQNGTLDGYLDSDYNGFYYDQNFASLWLPNDQIPFNHVATLADWQTLTGLDAHSIEGNPEFRSLSPLNVRLKPNSPYIKKGANLSPSITKDKDLDSRTAPYDIGADEYTRGNPNRPRHKAEAATVPSTFALFPNPTNSTVKIDLTNTDAQYIKIYNVLGQEVRSVTVTARDFTTSIKGLVSGTYSVALVKDGAITQTEKLVILK